MASGLSSRQRLIQTSLVKTPANRDILLWRSLFIMLGITSLMGVCLFRLIQLQLIDGQQHQQQAELNRIRPVPLPADRGNIIDRDGALLASNQLARGVYLWPRQQSPQQWKGTAARLSRILGIPAEEILARLEQTGYHSPLPVPVAQTITPDAFVALAEQAVHFPGVEVLAGSTRFYPYNHLAAHAIGYIGEATAADLAANPDYPFGMIVGQMGIERLVNAELEGNWGKRLIEVDARGQEVRLLGVEPPISGSTVQLTLDLEMQQAAEKALNGRRGAVVALNVHTGAILTLASSPSFNPNMFTRRVSETDWQRLQQGDQPFLNRALQTYPPGSTFKIVTSAAAIESGKLGPDSILSTSAFITLGNHQFWEHSRQGYGAIGFREALAYSSNTFFYQAGLMVGPETISEWGKRLGIGSTRLGLEGENSGMIPTPDQKESLYGEPWYGGDTVSTAIGQGLVQASPLELAVMVAAIANGGNRVQPHLLASQTNTSATQKQPTGLSDATIQAIRSGLVAAVQQGTAQRLNDGSIPLTAGKTGTSEVIGQQPHALYVGYGPVSDPQIAIAVIVENGGYGGVTAIPVAHEVYKKYFQQAKKN
ncbi:penicillin-binding protein 2 [Thermocoleostomius sinensis]|uniref:Penicillin-binding protein 2 n=1 Tax=Thermocoleostomius sinensis A174 TaxID=2016057 RepID=A0A9E8ZG18_9CYAN|nr:penicillin-binding protein 2 [Thermocoleostomius sinensis]WAL62755.1 penicillin-binding protein 2 [Thermocoleostomius sinensis A174]